jgi:hypothetical protein
MTNSTPSPYLSDNPTSDDPTSSWSVVVEVLSSLLAVSGIGAMMLNWFFVNLTFFGVEPVVEPFNVTVYRVALVALVVGTVLAICSIYWRTTRPGKSMYWHGLVAIAGLLVAVACHMSVG